MVWNILRIVIAFGAALILYLIGASIVRNFAKAEPPPDEPDVSILEDVDYRYRCIVCGAQAVVYSAPEGELPDAPRHCREPMVLVPPVE
jgi:hypothetical protein